MQNAQFLGARQVPNVAQHQIFAPIYPGIPRVPVRKRRPRGIGDKNGGEKKRVHDRLNGFIAKESIIWNEMKRRFGENLRHGELLSIAEVVAMYSGVFLDRDAKRRKTVLIKWFQENWIQILPFLSFVVLEDRSKRKNEEGSKGSTTDPVSTQPVAPQQMYQPLWIPQRM